MVRYESNHATIKSTAKKKLGYLKEQASLVEHSKRVSFLKIYWAYCPLKYYINRRKKNEQKE
jgi:hypothetical protein